MKNKTITKVIRVDNETKKLMADFYKDMKRDKTPPYAIFQADTGDTIVTLYESGKAMFQGVSADIEAGMWESIGKDKENIDYFIDREEVKEKKEERSFMNKFMKKLAYFLDKQGYFLLNISVISKKYGTEFNKIYRK